jgi:hypothetical protein
MSRPWVNCVSAHTGALLPRPAVEHGGEHRRLLVQVRGVIDEHQIRGARQIGNGHIAANAILLQRYGPAGESPFQAHRKR